MAKFLLTDNVKPSKKKVVGIAYVAPWRSGDLGWAVPNFITHKCIERPTAERAPYAAGEWAYRCKVTIELFPDKRGRNRRVRIV